MGPTEHARGWRGGEFASQVSGSTSQWVRALCLIKSDTNSWISCFWSALHSYLNFNVLHSSVSGASVVALVIFSSTSLIHMKNVIDITFFPLKFFSHQFLVSLILTELLYMTLKTGTTWCLKYSHTDRVKPTLIKLLITCPSCPPRLSKIRWGVLPVSHIISNLNRRPYIHAGVPLWLSPFYFFAVSDHFYLYNRGQHCKKKCTSYACFHPPLYDRQPSSVAAEIDRHTFVWSDSTSY